MTCPVAVSGRAGGCEFAVRVIPRAGRTAVAGVRGGSLLIRLAAAPVEGAANDALVAFLGDLLERPRRDITVASGHKSRDKRVRIAGLSAHDLASKLSGILPA